ncbi:hypothetical protein V8B97DRAFT_1107930 [Scleroderma yunnanense]
MLTTSLSSGWYTITSNTGPVDTCQVGDSIHVVVNQSQYFYVELLSDGTYVIHPNNWYDGTVQTTSDYRLVAQSGQQPWVITSYGDQANTYTIVEVDDSSLAWTDEKQGSPGCDHWLYVDAFDPTNVPPSQQFTIVPANGLRGKIHKRK